MTAPGNGEGVQVHLTEAQVAWLLRVPENGGVVQGLSGEGFLATAELVHDLSAQVKSQNGRAS